MRWLVVFTVLLVVEYYAWQAFRHASFLQQNPAKTIALTVLGLLLVMTYGYLFGIMFGWTSGWPKSLDTLVRALVFIILFSKLIIGGFMVLDDVRRVVVWLTRAFGLSETFQPGRSAFLANAAVIIGGLPFISLLYGVLRNGYRYRVHRHVVNKEGLPSALHGLKIVQISDIHAGSFYKQSPLLEAVDLINAEKPDLVFFTGDLVNNVATEIIPYKSIFANIKAKYGVFSVLGNHDYGDYVAWPNLEDKRNNLNQLATHHGDMGWQLLMNEHRVIPIQGHHVAVLGVENFSAHPRFPKYGSLGQASAGCPEDVSLKILLTHDPSHWHHEVTKNFTDIDLTLSGHTHGFQFGVEIPGWVKWSPAQYIYKEWAGLYREGKQYLNVNRGLGFLGYPGRVGILPEITSIELQGV